MLANLSITYNLVGLFNKHAPKAKLKLYFLYWHRHLYIDIRFKQKQKEQNDFIEKRSFIIFFNIGLKLDHCLENRNSHSRCQNPYFKKNWRILKYWENLEAGTNFLIFPWVYHYHNKIANTVVFEKKNTNLPILTFPREIHGLDSNPTVWR